MSFRLPIPAATGVLHERALPQGLAGGTGTTRSGVGGAPHDVPFIAGCHSILCRGCVGARIWQRAWPRRAGAAGLLAASVTSAARAASLNIDFSKHMENVIPSSAHPWSVVSPSDSSSKVDQLGAYMLLVEGDYPCLLVLPCYCHTPILFKSWFLVLFSE